MTNSRNEWMLQEAMVKRDYSLNMPHMALGGMSESWLFREFGDIHWTMLSEGLGQPSSKLADANGDRLYATFTRIYYTSSVPIKRFSENEEITATAKTARFGGGVLMMLRSRAPISENCRVLGIGVAVSVRVSTELRSVLSLSLTATPNFCSSSIIMSPRSLNLIRSETMAWVPIKISVSPDLSFWIVFVVSLVLLNRFR